MDPLFKTWLDDHIFTPSELEDYLLCPFRFYARAFLKLKEETIFEIEMTPAEKGQLLHRILERFLASKQEILSVMEEVLSDFQRDRPHLSPVLFSLEKKKIERTLLSFIEQQKNQSSQRGSLTPKYFEWKFSGLTLKERGGRPIQIRGRIDRIDVDPVNKRFLVIDYKTGSTKITGNQIRSGESLQLPLYIMAVRQLLLPDDEPIGGLYFHLSDMSQKDGILHADRLPPFLELHPRSSSLVPAAQWEAIFEKTTERVCEIVSEIRKGEFLSKEEPCDSYCPYQDICRIRANS